jgi:protein-S-isoprenylcysteine O-methyltransferase Ste14
MAKRTLVFTFGLLAYCIFAACFIYMIGFLGSLIVPKSIDSGPKAPLLAAVLIDLALVALFGLQHSLMARASFKKRLLGWVPEPAVRSVFVLCSSLALGSLYWGWRPFGGTIWSFSEGPLYLGLQALFWIGWGMVALSTFLIDHFDLFGLRQVYLYLRGEAYTPVRFKMPAPYRYVRHPLMFSILVAFWATPHMSLGHFLFAAGMTAYILLGIRYEERDLLKSYGQTYDCYRHAVSMLVPLPRREQHGSKSLEPQITADNR